MFILFSVAVCDVELKFEATDGENFSIPLGTVELERANRVRITFKGEYEDKVHLIMQFCAHGETCSVVETPGVLLSIEQRTLTLQDVSSNSSGLYEALVFIGNNVSKIKATLVNKPAFSPSTALLHTSTPNPPNSSEHQQLYALLIIPAIFLGVVFYFCRREREPLADVEKAKETPAVSRTSIFKKNYWKRNCSDCAAVSFKACTEDTDDQLVDT